MRLLTTAARRPLVLGALALGALTLAACQNTSDPGNSGVPETADTSTGVPTNPGLSAGVDTAGANATLSDAQILHVFVTTNRGEVVTSEPVAAATAGDSAKAYARDMVAMHGMVLQQAEGLGTREGLAPEANPVSAGLEARATEVAGALRALRGAELDRAYVGAQVELHQNTLDLLTNRLIPNAQNGALRTMLEGARPAVAAHLERARALQAAAPAGTR